jgi:hypothetical protein
MIYCNIKYATAVDFPVSYVFKMAGIESHRMIDSREI